MMFRTPKTRVNKFCDWDGFLRVHSVRLTIVVLQNFSSIAEVRDLNLEFFSIRPKTRSKILENCADRKIRKKTPQK